MVIVALIEQLQKQMADARGLPGIPEELSVMASEFLQVVMSGAPANKELLDLLLEALKTPK